MCPWTTKPVLSSMGIFVAIANNALYGSKLSIFINAKHQLRSCSLKIFSQFSAVNISKRTFWLVICIAKNFIWTTLKVMFSIFRFFCPPQISDFQRIVVSQPNIVRQILTNHTSIESLFISFQIIFKSQFKHVVYDWFCGSWSHIMTVDSPWPDSFYFMHSKKTSKYIWVQSFKTGLKSNTREKRAGFNKKTWDLNMLLFYSSCKCVWSCTQSNRKCSHLKF